tara:strand:- start:175 stop:369 length:195 start_codon:yes stop_codon:yes gene_type:complete
MQHPLAAWVDCQQMLPSIVLLDSQIVHEPAPHIRTAPAPACSALGSSDGWVQALGIGHALNPSS